ncbi:hypothetical protein [Roseovarius sp. MMSF_3281]|uniref:hypothetical protein n=1 Tax=Roseovarius sp. MMSF_3281 TaxID=3046694 RepID=UPI00273FBD5A|nr:hypothetical protein [Roseovarius sp. MMSF_3281]
MLPLRIRNATRILAESQDEYHALAIRDEKINGQNYMISVWELTPREIEDLKSGGTVQLMVLGTAHPPVMLCTQPAPNSEDGSNPEGGDT